MPSALAAGSVGAGSAVAVAVGVGSAVAVAVGSSVAVAVGVGSAVAVAVGSAVFTISNRIKRYCCAVSRESSSVFQFYQYIRYIAVNAY